MGGKTEIEIEKKDGYMSITARGHNKDKIVCAWVSAIMQTAELGLKALAETVNSVIIKEWKD